MILEGIKPSLLNYIWILGHCCLIIGLSGIYFSKTKNFGSVKKSEEKEGIEQKRSYGIYVFYVITIIGIICILISILQMGKYIVYIRSLILTELIMGYLPLTGGLLILYFKKKKAYKYPDSNWDILKSKYSKSETNLEHEGELKTCPHCKKKIPKVRQQCPYCHMSVLSNFLWFPLFICKFN